MWSCNLGLALGMAFKFYTSVASVKTKTQKVLGANSKPNILLSTHLNFPKVLIKRSTKLAKEH